MAASLNKVATKTVTSSWVTVCTITQAAATGIAASFSAVLRAKGAGRLELRLMRDVPAVGPAIIDDTRGLAVAPFFPGVEREVSLQAVVNIADTQPVYVQARWRSAATESVTLVDSRFMLVT